MQRRSSGARPPSTLVLLLPAARASPAHARGMRKLIATALVSYAAAMAPTKIRSATPKYAPMPDMLTSTIPGTWAHDTMSRVEVASSRTSWTRSSTATIEDEAWFSDAKPSLDALRAEILADAELRPIEGAGEDVADWNQLLAKYPGGTWLSAPWLVAEFYLYIEGGGSDAMV